MNVDLERLAKWVAETCLMFGATPRTAMLVAATFVEQLERDAETEAL